MTFPLRALLPIAFALVLGAHADAQSFNLDVEHALHSAPSLPDTYGGAPLQRGRWQKVVFPGNGPLPPVPLVDVNGVATGVTIEADRNPFANSPSCSPLWLADDVNLYDGIRRDGGFMLVHIRGLQNGWYTVYVYGVDEQSVGNSATTEVRLFVPGGTNPGFAQYRGFCTSAHSLNETYTAVRARVVNGELSMRLSKGFDTPESSWALSAIQLDFRVGATYCVPGQNSTGGVSVLRATSTQWIQEVASVGANNLVLAADGIPPGRAGFFLYSRSRHPGTGGYGSLGGGYRCLLGAVGRLPVADTATTPGMMLHALDNTSPPRPSLTILAGSTWHFQGLYTDTAPGGVNLTNAVSVDFGL